MDLNAMRDEAYATSKSKGWYEKGRGDVPTLLALVHSEISEALEAWRETGDEGIQGVEIAHSVAPWAPGQKPEGVAAELADVVIRIGDMAGAYELDLNASSKVPPRRHPNFWKGADLPTRLAFLHADVSNGLMHWNATRSTEMLALHLYEVVAETQQICDDFKIDLDAAVRAKMAFNKTRSYRHGNKKV